MAIDTACPNCVAPHAKKLSLIYTEGLSTVQLTGETTSRGKTNNIISTKITTTGTSTSSGIQQSQISKDSAPPVVEVAKEASGSVLRDSIIIIGGFAAIVLSIVAYAVFSTFSSSMITIIALFFVIIMYAQSIDTKRTALEEDEYDRITRLNRKVLADWNNTYSCTACGHRFIPGEFKLQLHQLR